MNFRTQLIQEFINSIKVKYPNLHIRYEYDLEIDEYYIWHDNWELEYKNKEFLHFVGEKAQEILFDNGIYNFSFG